MLDVGEDIVVVGAGPVGLACALVLQSQGHKVHVFEGRADPGSSALLTPGRSISLTLTTRGWRALTEAGVEAAVRQIAFPLRGRTIHLEDGQTHFHPYGPNQESIDSVNRDEFVRVLVEEARRRNGIELTFEHRCLGFTPDRSALRFLRADHSEVQVRCTRVVAADGVNSIIRRAFSHLRTSDQSNKYSRHFYREITIRAPGEAWALDPGSLHVWPRGDCLLVAFPSRTKRFTGTIFMPLDGPVSFNALHRPELLRAQFESSFPDLVDLTPNLIPEFYGGPPWSLGSMSCYPWVFLDRVALLGDAAHTMVPFLGQGLNAGLEDVSVLVRSLNELKGSWASALQLYQARRKPNCDAVIALAEEHYRELALDARDPEFILRKQVEAKLIRLLPSQFSTPYTVISFTERPYQEVQAVAQVQRLVVSRMLEIPNLKDRLDTPEIEDELRARAIATLAALAS